MGYYTDAVNNMTGAANALGNAVIGAAVTGAHLKNQENIASNTKAMAEEAKITEKYKALGQEAKGKFLNTLTPEQAAEYFNNPEWQNDVNNLISTRTSEMKSQALATDAYEAKLRKEGNISEADKVRDQGQERKKFNMEQLDSDILENTHSQWLVKTNTAEQAMNDIVEAKTTQKNDFKRRLTAVEKAEKKERESYTKFPYSG